MHRVSDRVLRTKKNLSWLLCLGVQICTDRMCCFKPPVQIHGLYYFFVALVFLFSFFSLAPHFLMFFADLFFPFSRFFFFSFLSPSLLLVFTSTSLSISSLPLSLSHRCLSCLKFFSYHLPHCLSVMRSIMASMAAITSLCGWKLCCVSVLVTTTVNLTPRRHRSAIFMSGRCFTRVVFSPCIESCCFDNTCDSSLRAHSNR